MKLTHLFLSALFFTHAAQASDYFHFERKLGLGGGLGNEGVELICAGETCKITQTRNDKGIHSVDLSAKESKKIFDDLEKAFKNYKPDPKQKPGTESILSVSLEHGKFKGDYSIPHGDCDRKCNAFRQEMLAIEHQFQKRLRK